MSSFPDPRFALDKPKTEHFVDRRTLIIFESNNKHTQTQTQKEGERKGERKGWKEGGRDPCKCLLNFEPFTWMMFFNHSLIELTFSSSLTEGNKRLVEQLGLYPRAGVDAWESHSLSVSQKALAGLIRSTETDLYSYLRKLDGGFRRWCWNIMLVYQLWRIRMELYLLLTSQNSLPWVTKLNTHLSIVPEGGGKVEVERARGKKVKSSFDRQPDFPVRTFLTRPLQELLLIERGWVLQEKKRLLEYS